MAWAAALGIWVCVGTWVVAGDVAHTRSLTGNFITGAIATLLALAATSGVRGGRRTLSTLRGWGWSRRRSDGLATR
ncbi:SPW repeat protein [Streptomyces sp. NPDC046876]|uniref:SPW repeat domain-containing protein n=1 Tax=Streptomyces sp. NPDC046876 TaxID=3155616 RepID=UPI0033D48C41